MGEPLAKMMPELPVVKRNPMPIHSLFRLSCANESIGENILSTLTGLAGGLGPV